MKSVISFVDKMNNWIFNLIAVIFGAIGVLMLYQVVARYVLHRPLVWSEELVRYAMIWIVFLGGSIALRKGLMISVEIVQFLVPPAVRKMMQIVTVVINIALLVVLAVYGFGIMENLAGQRTGAMDFPVAWTYAAIPVGALLGIVNCLVVFVELFTKREVGDTDGGNFIS